MRHSQSVKHTVQLVHVDTSQLDLKHEFKLSRVQPTDDGDSGETIYELKPSEQPSQDMQVKSNFSFNWTKALYQNNFKLTLSTLQSLLHFLKAKDINK